MANPHGRPTLLTPDMQARICAYLRISGTRRMAAQAVGINEHTIWEWCQRHPDFALAIEQAEQDAKLSLLACLHKQARKGSTKAAAWLLERRGGQDFAPPAQQIDVSLAMENLSDDDLARLAATQSPTITEITCASGIGATEEETRQSA